MPEALSFDLHMFALGTLILGLPESWAAIGMLGRHYMALAACDTVVGVALAPATLAYLVKMA